MKNALFIFLVLLILPVFAFSFILRWDDKPGTKYKSNTYFRQKVYRNRRYRFTGEGRNKNVLTVISSDGRIAEISGLYYLYEKFLREPYYKLTKVEKTIFKRTHLGVDIVPHTNFYPVIRSALKFPEHEVKIGDEWEYTGGECQPSRVSGFKRATHWQLHFKNKLLEEVIKNGKKLLKIRITYTINQKLPRTKSSIYPVLVTGKMEGYYLWDTEEKYSPYYRSKGHYFFLFNRNRSVKSLAYYYSIVETYTSKLKSVNDQDRKIIKKEIQKSLKKNDIKLKVRDDKKGVVIELDNILFDFNSAKLKNKAKGILNRLAPIIKKYKDRDIRIEVITAGV